MGFKHNDTCLAKAGDDEPIFVLRSTDRLAPALVHLWAELALAHGCGLGKVQEAKNLAEQMQRWAKTHGDKWPD